MEHINNFSGMNQDLTKSLLPKDKYRSATNARLITEGLDSSGAITNADGNILSFNIPTISNVIKLEIPDFTQVVSFNISGTLFSQIFRDHQNVTDIINTALNPNIKAAASNTAIFIYSPINPATNQPYTANIAISFPIAPPNCNIVNGVEGTGNNFINAQTPNIIGSTEIRDDFILFTTSATSRNPGGHSSLPANPSTSGQIWRVSYLKKAPFTATLQLLYNNYIDFTTFHPIPPSAAEGRYETSTIQKVFWTDNFNELRFFNTTDLNGFAIDPSLLNSRALVDMDLPILQRIGDSGGNTNIGIYQAAYRLKNPGGGATVYSKCSNMVPIHGTTVSSATSFRDFIGGGQGPSNKTITWNIDNLDTDYERIEIVILYRERRQDIPKIDQVFDEPVPSNGNFTFTYTGNEPAIPVDLNEFLNVNTAFTHCKTIKSKTNQLLAGNVRVKTFDVDFDARAYRWKHVTAPGFNTNQTTVLDSQGNIQIVDKTVLSDFGVPETHDAINSDQSTQNVTSFRFQSDGITLGGEGPNIKYTFKALPFIGDSNTSGNGFGNMVLDKSLGKVGENGRFTNPQPAPITVNNNVFSNNNFYDSFKSPYKASALKGYQHDEVYRFGIRFFDKTGRPGFAKWIADIRMPLIFESLDNSLPTFKDFPISDFAPSGEQRVNILTPEFTVTIPTTLQDKISGWEIVRVERGALDKTILGAGYIFQTTKFTPNINAYYTVQSGDVNNTSPIEKYHTLGTAIWQLLPTAQVGTAIGDKCSFISPEVSFLGFPGFSQGDQLKITGATIPFATAVSTNPGAVHDQVGFAKAYSQILLNSPDAGKHTLTRTITGSIPLIRPTTNQGTALTSISADQVYNYSAGYSGANGVQSLGEQQLFLELSSNLPFDPQDLIYYAYYVRPVTSQYGGSSYSARSNNEYISCGHYQEITAQTIISTPFSITLHGDLFTTVWDIQRRVKNHNILGTPSKTRADVWWFPVESVINTEWRHGDSINRVGLNTDGTSITDNGEDFLYNTVFSAEDNIKKAFVKPVPFEDTQEYDNRIHLSSVKINGEQTDSWGIWPPLEYRDLEGSKGAVNSLQLFKDNIYAIQDDAVSIVPVNQNVIIPDNSSSTLQLGSGKGLEKPVYIGTTEGSRHQWSCLTTDSAIYFFDIKTKEIMQVTNQAEPIVIIKGMASYFDNNIINDITTDDNPVHLTNNIRTGILAVYDYQNGDVLYTFHDNPLSSQKSFTLSYNELTSSFVSFYDFTPAIYIGNKRNIFSSNNLSSVWLHNEGNPGQFYGTTFPCKLSLLVNPQPAETKVFDNFEFSTEVLNGTNNILTETWSKLRAYTDHQNSGFISLVPNSNILRKERQWNLHVPRNAVIQSLTSVNVLNPVNLSPAQLFKDRMRDRYINIDLEYDNLSQNKLICPYFLTKFKPSAR
jgi:hypothetical protein